MKNNIYPIEYFANDTDYELTLKGAHINCVLAVLGFVSDLVETLDVSSELQTVIKDICDCSIAFGSAIGLKEGRLNEETYCN